MVESRFKESARGVKVSKSTEETKDTKEIPAAAIDPLTGLTVGCNVHYVMPNGFHAAAIVVFVYEDTLSGREPGTVELYVFKPYNGRGYELDTAEVQFDPAAHVYTWHFIESES